MNKELHSISLFIPLTNECSNKYKICINNMKMEINEYRNIIKNKSINSIVINNKTQVLLFHFKKWHHIANVIYLYNLIHNKEELLNEVYSSLVNKSVNLADSQFQLLNANMRKL